MKLREFSLLADGGVDPDVADHLRSLGWDVLTAAPRACSGGPTLTSSGRRPARIEWFSPEMATSDRLRSSEASRWLAASGSDPALSGRQ